MHKLYKGDVSCDCDKDQISLLLKNGWSRSKPKKVTKPQAAQSNFKSQKAVSDK